MWRRVGVDVEEELLLQGGCLAWHRTRGLDGVYIAALILRGALSHHETSERPGRHMRPGKRSSPANDVDLVVQQSISILVHEVSGEIKHNSRGLKKLQALIVAWQRTSSADLGSNPLAPRNQSAHVAS